MRLFLIRHGQSEGNADDEVYRNTPNHSVRLTELGMDQAHDAGIKLKRFFEKNPPKMAGQYSDVAAKFAQSILGQMQQSQNIEEPKAQIWVSPFVRTQETARIIYGINKKYILGGNQSWLITERNLGIYTTLGDLAAERRFPSECEAYNLQIKRQGYFWAKPPQGESRYDVVLRAQQFLNELGLIHEQHQTNDFIIVSHADFINTFIFNYMNHSLEWLDNQKNPNNCSIRVLEDGKDLGILSTTPA